MTDLLREAAERAATYLSNLGTRPVFPSSAALSRLTELGGKLPDAPSDPEKVLELLDEIGSPATVASAGGRYFGFVVGGTLPVALAANWLAAAWDQNAMSQRQFSGRCQGRGDRHPLASGVAAPAWRLCRGLGDRGHDGELHRLGCGPPLRSAETRMGCRGRWSVRFATRDRDRQRASPPHVIEGSQPVGIWSQTPCASSGGRAGTNAGRRSADHLGANHHLYPGGEREHGSLRSGRERYAKGRRRPGLGSTSMVPSGCGLLPHPIAAT